VADDVARDCQALEPALTRIRRTLHAHPELSGGERETAALVAAELRRLELDVRTGVGGTGVMADIGPPRGGALLLRADLDALPLQETSGRPYGSTVPGVMHACGHDAHVAALLGAATLLSRRRGELKRPVRLLFQPAEEVGRGARAVIDDGALAGVEAAVATHVIAPLPFGQVAVWRDGALCGVDFFELELEGAAGHSAQARAGSGVVLAASQMIAQLDGLASDGASRGLLLAVVASVQAGHAANVLAARAMLRGTIRWQHQADREGALERVAQQLEAVTAATGTIGRWSIPARVPVLRNAPAIAALVDAAVHATGRAHASDPGLLPFSDDFAHIAERVPACYVGVGAGGPHAAPHHHPAFDVDERAIGLSAEILTRTALAWTSSTTEGTSATGH
jgi:amidohydrolase